MSLMHSTDQVLFWIAYKTASGFCIESLLGNQSLWRATTQYYSYPQGTKQCNQSKGRASAEVGGSATKATNGTASAYHL